MSVVKHIVLLEFKPETTPAQIEGFFSALAGLQDLVPGLTGFEGGPYSSGEGLNQGFSHGFVMTFQDAAARDGYLPHPEHVKVKEAIIPFVQNLVAFDYVV